jgi:molecular chaperone DnaK (HSP70)
MTMNLARITIIGVVILGVCLCDIGVKAQTTPLSVSIEIDNSSVKLGADIQVKATLKNNTDQDVQVSELRTAADNHLEYKVTVERDDHTAVAKKYAEKLRRHEVPRDPLETGSVHFVPIQPGKTHEDSVNISNRYEFDKPGKYSIQLERELPESLGGGVIKSNTITVTVTP